MRQRDNAHLSRQEGGGQHGIWGGFTVFPADFERQPLEYFTNEETEAQEVTGTHVLTFFLGVHSLVLLATRSSL